jgi:SAM-dependent methyltransferase
VSGAESIEQQRRLGGRYRNGRYKRAEAFKQSVARTNSLRQTASERRKGFAVIKATDIHVDPRIASNDGMLGGNEQHYFSVGRSALWNIARALEHTAGGSAQPNRILDLPCGHGRVLRYLRAAFPKAEITACDLLTDGVDFCASTFGAIGVYSDTDLSLIELPRNAFDLIWVGSLFTHLGAKQWTGFLTLFRDLLVPGGTIVFSTQGRLAHGWIKSGECVYGLDATGRRRIVEQYETAGFGHVDYPGSHEYGISLAEPSWVCRLITSVPDLRLTHVSEKSWDDHHDIYACVRDVDWKAHCTLSPTPETSRSALPRVMRKNALLPWERWWKRTA